MSVLPLNRLIKRNEATAWLTQFSHLMPGVKLALTKADGDLFADIGQWHEAELAEFLAQANSPLRGLYMGDWALQPLIVNDHWVGALVAFGPLNEAGWQCLHYTLTLFLHEVAEKRSLANEALERYREINLLYHITETIGSNLDPDIIPQLVLTEAVRVIQADMGAILLPSAENRADLKVRASFGYDETDEFLEGVTHYLIEQVYETGHPEIFTSLSLASSPVDVILCVPLKIRDHILGIILLGRKVQQTVFTASDEKLLMALANQTAIAIDTAWLHQREIKRQRLDKELALGQQIQLSLLPESCPTIPGWEFAAIYQSARQVGGDFYDFFELPGEPRRLGLLIADVTGKGVPAALFMAFSRSIIRTIAMNGGNPAAVLEQTNRLIVQDNRSGIFLTAFYAILELETGKLIYASGGHNWPLWLPQGQLEAQELAAEGFLLGAFDPITLQEQAVQLAMNDTLVFFTDGVTEAMNAVSELFGDDRLQAVAVTKTTDGAEATLQSIVTGVKQFTQNTPQSDDFTLFVVKRVKA